MTFPKKSANLAKLFPLFLPNIDIVMLIVI